MFVDHTLTVIVDPDGLEGIQFAWTFDEMFSSMIVLTFDADKDKSISAAEAKSVEQKHFSNLKDFGYFMQLRVNDKPVAITAYRDFQVKLANGQVVYVFTVPVKAAEGTLEIAVDDPDLLLGVRAEPALTRPGPEREELPGRLPRGPGRRERCRGGEMHVQAPGPLMRAVTLLVALVAWMAALAATPDASPLQLSPPPAERPQGSRGPPPARTHSRARPVREPASSRSRASSRTSRPASPSPSASST